jgi:hypothetical protein
VEAVTVPYTVLLAAREEKRPLRRVKYRGISSDWNRGVRIGFIYFTSGSNYSFANDNKQFGSIKYRKFLRD